MEKKNNGGIKVLMFLFMIGVFAVPFISSCGKTAVNASSSNIQYQIVNLSPSLGPISLYIDYRIYNNANFYYPRPSGYFYLSSINPPFQIRSSPNQTAGTVITVQGNILSISDTLKPNLRYTLFVTGLLSDSSINRVFLTDTSSAPAIGRGKIRFLNASPQSGAFDVWANDKRAFSNAQYNVVTPFMELPAGSYNFNVYAKGTSTGIIGSEQNVIIQDGRLYTIYSYGIAGHTDSVAFGMGTVTNK